MNKNIVYSTVSLCALLLIVAATGKPQGDYVPAAEAVVPAASPRLNADFGRIPLQFIPNAGQVDEQVGFYVLGRDKSIYFTAEGLTFVLNGIRKPEEAGQAPHQRMPHDLPARSSSERWAVKLDFVDANPESKPVGLEESGAVFSYFKGQPDEWRAGLRASSKIIYRELWPGIDLIYYGTVDRMKYEFVVRPGADPLRIKLAYRGAEDVSLTDEGRLAVTTPAGAFEDDIPVAWQEIEGKRTGVAMAYRLSESVRETGDQIYGFEVGEYDRAHPLVLDPAVLVYCGYVGGTATDYGTGVAVDSSGNAYIVGYTWSQASFPATVGPDTSHNNEADAFIAKINPSGTSLLYCGFVGGSSDDVGAAIAVDAGGNAYITGYTLSSESSFPVANGPVLTHSGSFAYDAFVAKIHYSGTFLSYCGYIGGYDSDYGYGIAVDGAGQAYVTGNTLSDEQTFPVLGGPSLTFSGWADAFVAKIDPTGVAFVYCGYIGGTSFDEARGIAVDTSGNAYVAGHTYSTELDSFPVTVGPALTHGGADEAFVAKINSSGTSLIYCGYIGGEGYDSGAAIAVDGNGCAYVAGCADSPEDSFPIVGGPSLVYGGSSDAFVAKVAASGASLEYCGYIGGTYSDQAFGIDVDDFGHAYVTGLTYSSESTFPVVRFPRMEYEGNGDAFVAKIAPGGTSLVYCGKIGGYWEDYSVGIAVDRSGRAYITGYTYSIETTFPVKVGPDLSHNNEWDAFVVKIDSNVRADFNKDDQEDILWRYYGSGGRNRIWFLDYSDPVPLPMPMGDFQMNEPIPSPAPARRAVESKMKLSDSGMGRLTRKGVVSVRDPREAVNPGNWREAPLSQNDLRIADPGMSAFSAMPGVSDPSYAIYAVGSGISASGRTGITTTSVVSGADVLAVPDLTWHAMGTGDFNNDGKTDVLWRYNGTGGRVRVWYMDGTTVTAGADIGSVSDLDWQIVGTGDFNGDGKVDLLWHNATSGRVRVWYLDGVSIIAGADILTVTDLNWKVMGTGDFNGDGHVDILWRHGLSGRNRVWFMDGISILSGADLLGVTDQNWQIAGTGDYNRDGHTDALWRYNGTGGYIYIWYLNGTTWIGTEKLIAVPDLTWRIVSR